MKRATGWCGLLVGWPHGLVAALFVCLAAPLAARGADPGPVPAPTGSPAYVKIVTAYLDCKADGVEALLTDLKPTNKDLDLTGAEDQDVTYIRQSLAESRPDWWNAVKAGKKQLLRALVWGQPLTATFDPALKGGVSINVGNGQTNLAVCWPTADMDNPAHAEHGFSKGELVEFQVWNNLGMADVYSTLPLSTLSNSNPEAKSLLGRYLSLRANLTGAYYSLPRARRWGLFLGVLWHLDKYAKDPSLMSRKSVAAMFVAEVAGHRENYPSIKLPAKPPAENTESQVALQIKAWIEKHGWTLAEDRALRETIKKFAAANVKNVLQSGKVTLANGLVVNLDPELDKPERDKRDAWLRTAWDKPAAATKPGP